MFAAASAIYETLQYAYQAFSTEIKWKSGSYDDLFLGILSIVLFNVNIICRMLQAQDAAYFFK